MALREPDREITRLEINYDDSTKSLYGEMDYRSSQVRDLRNAVNEWIAGMEIPIALVKRIVPVFDQLEDTISTLAKRVEALEKNTPKGGHVLGGGK